MLKNDSQVSASVRQIGVCRSASKFPVIARPVRTLVVAIPRLVGKCIDNYPTELENLAIFGGNRYIVPFNGGIATPVCALARNDSKERTNTNLSIRFLFVPKGHLNCPLSTVNCPLINITTIYLLTKADMYNQ